jgi:hypothetical protein
LLRGPFPSELEADLTQVEERLRSLATDDTYSPAERKLETSYFGHWQAKLRLMLAKADPSSGERDGHNEEVREGPSNQSKPSDESWRVITPLFLLRAVLNIREDFKRLSSAHHHYFERRCFNDLHPLVSGTTEPAVFKIHFFACINKLREIVTQSFGRFFKISLSQDGLIGEAPAHWAFLQVFDLTEGEDRHVEEWVKSVCDGSSNVLPDTDKEFWEKVVFRTDWRAPQWLIMQPNGNRLYSRATAWERMSEGDTRRILSYLRESRWILLLKATLTQNLGAANEVLARRKQEPHATTAATTQSAPNRRRPGRKPRLPRAFVVFAGTLWRDAKSQEKRVSENQLRQIAAELDVAGHLGPAKYLEGKYAEQVKNFNSRHSNSKIGPLRTWSQLVSNGDKDHLQGMRRLLSRCAAKASDDHPASGINSGQKTSS